VGGAERHVVAVASTLRLRGWQTNVFALSPHGPLLDPLVRAGVLVAGPNLPTWFVTILGPRLGGWLNHLFSVALIVLDLRRHPETVVHFFLPGAYILGGIAALLVNARPRIMSRRSLNRYQNNNPLYRKVEHFLHPKMDALLGNSQAVVNELMAEVQGRCPVRLIYNGIEPRNTRSGVRRRMRRDLGLDEETLVISVVANLIPYKGHEDLLKALHMVEESMSFDWRLLCIGRDDGIGISLQALTKVLGLDGNVIWLGARLDAQDCLVASDIAVSASHEEGFSNAVLEAMNEGLPMVVTDVGGNSEAVVDNVTGYVVPSHDPLALGAAILKLALDPRRADMGALGRSRVIQRFSMEACLDAYEALYFEMSAKRI
jgi:glycosyltransferase involved in cell wall biosynthesis